MLQIINLTFMGPCIINIFQYIYIYIYTHTHTTRCNFTQFIYIWKLLYMFRVVLPPIIRSTYNCIYIYLPLSCRSWNSSTIAADSSNSVTNTRCCRYSCMCSWWWMEVPPKTCRAVSRNIINCIKLHLVGYILEYTDYKFVFLNISISEWSDISKI
jgi:hypothetical protein